MAAPKTVKTYDLNGTLKDFPINFEYLARKFIVVTLIGVDRRELVLNTDYRFSTSTQITTMRSSAWGPGDGYDLIEIRRVTSATDRLVDFADGSILRAFDLNTSQVQSLHIAEEARDLTADTISVDNDGNLDARARRIVNLADPVDPGDAVTLRMNQQWAGSALNQATLSQQSAVASEASRQAAIVQANASAASAGSSQTSRLASEAARDLSQSWASKAEDSIVASGLYSAYHYMRKALGFSTASQTSANDSANSATQSANSATASQTSANASAASAGDALTQANRATTEADRAATEADKLGNMNELGGALDAVTGTAVRWKGSSTSRQNYIWAPTSGGESSQYFSDFTGNIRFRASANEAGDYRIVDDATSMVRLTVAKSGKVTAGYGLQVDGATTLNGASTVNAMTFNGGAIFNSTAQFKNGNVQVYAATTPANAHVWFYGPDGTSRGIIYAEVANTVRIQAGGVIAASFLADGTSFLNGVTTNAITANGAVRTNYSIDNYGRVASYRQGVSAVAGMYAACHFMAQTDDGTAPAYGFHRGGSYAVALWLSGTTLHMMDSGGVDREIVTNASLNGWAVSTLYGESIGGISSCQNASGVTLGLNQAVAGSSLRYSSHNSTGSAPPGTWRCMGYCNNGGVACFQRTA